MVASKLTRLDEKTIWEHLKVVRKKKVCGFSGENIGKNNEFFESELDHTVTGDELKVWPPGLQNLLIKDGWDNFGKMFIFLNNCENKFHRYFKDLIHNKSPTEIALSALNFVKNSPTAEGELLGNIIMREIADDMGFQHYKPQVPQVLWENVTYVTSRGKF